MATLTSVITGGPRAHGVRAGCLPFSLNSRPEDHSVSLISYSSIAWVRSRPRALEMATVRSVTTRGPRNLVVRAEAATNLLSDVGLSYGRRATSLPPLEEVLRLYQEKGISKMSLSPTGNGAITILDGIIQTPVKMQVVLCIDYSDLNELANEESAREWIGKYITPYVEVIRYICVGNVTGSFDFSFPLFRDAMRNLKQSIPTSASIKLSAIADVSKLLQDYDAEMLPSSCRLTKKAKKVVRLLSRLNGSPSPLFVRIMPYFMMYSEEDLSPDNLLLEDSAKAYMWDGDYRYRHAFDAMLDGVCCALTIAKDELGKVDIHVVSGWPTKGSSPDASLGNAQTYIKNLLRHVHVATPRYNKPADVFIYSLVDEDTLPTAVEEFKHLGAKQFLVGG